MNPVVVNNSNTNKPPNTWATLQRNSFFIDNKTSRITPAPLGATPSSGENTPAPLGATPSTGENASAPLGATPQ